MTSPSDSRQGYLLPTLLGGCFVLWLAFVGSWHRNELIVGAVAVVLATAFFVFVQRCEELKIELSARDAAQGLWVPWYILAGALEIILVLGKDLAQIQTAKSLFLVTPFQTLQNPRGKGRQVLAVLYTTATPTSIVITIDPGRQQMLYHQFERSSLPPMTRKLGAME